MERVQIVDRSERVKIRDTQPGEARTHGSYLLDMETIQRFCEFIRRGLPADGVCDLMCIAYSTFWNWVRRGERYLAGNNQPVEDDLYGEFVRSYKQALAGYRLERVELLHDPLNKNWVRELAILERRDRKSFGRNDPAGGNEGQYQKDDRFL